MSEKPSTFELGNIDRRIKDPDAVAAWIHCLRCGFTSYNVHDIAQLYCHHCGLWHRDPYRADPPAAPIPAIPPGQVHVSRRAMLCSFLGIGAASGAAGFAAGRQVAELRGDRDLEATLAQVTLTYKELVECEVQETLIETGYPPSSPWEYDLLRMTVRMPLRDYKFFLENCACRCYRQNRPFPDFALRSSS